jgi:alkylated DNA repair dioxygenase AlkB
MDHIKESNMSCGVGCVCDGAHHGVPELVTHKLEVPLSCKVPAYYMIGMIPSHMQVPIQTDTLDLFTELWNLHPASLGQVKMFGKTIDTPRYQMNYGTEYYYTGMLHPANSIPHPYLEKLLSWVQTHSGEKYEQMILNWYRDGSDNIGLHADSETGIVPNSAIYSITLGGTRDFVIKAKNTSYRKVLPLKNNTLLIMGGSMQKHYKHAVPKRVRAQPRINITFRLMK